MSRVSVQLRQDQTWMTVPARGVTMKREAPGGMISAAFKPDDRSPVARLLRTDAQVHITSRSTTQTLWSGRVADPTAVSVDGDASLLASYARRPYIVKELSAWERDDQHTSTQAGTLNVTTVDVTPTWPALVAQIPEGTSISPSGGTRLRLRTYAYDGTGYAIGVLHARHCEPVISDMWRTYGVIGVDNGSARLWEASFSQTPGEAIYARGASSNFSAASTLATVAIETTAALNYSTADSRRWSGFPILTTVAQLRDRNGAEINPMPQRSTLYAHEIVEDLLGRDLRGVVSTAPIDSVVNASHLTPLDSLWYDDPVNPARVLDDLVAHTLGDYYYAIWPGTDSTGRPGLWWMPWPASPRYLLPPGRTTVTVTGSDEGLCNRVRVRWADQYNKARETVVTSTPAQYPELSDLGYWDETNGWARVVEAPPLDLGEGRSSSVMASQVAQAYARQCATRPRGGSARVGRGDVMDLYKGEMVPPEEILPGYLAWSPELGMSLRVTATTYDDDTETTVMQLDSPRSSVEQLIARALRAAQRKGR